MQKEKEERRKKKAAEAGAQEDTIEEKSYSEFKEKFYPKMEAFAQMKPEDCEDWILENPEVLQEEAAGHMLIYMLNLEMSGQTAKMKRAARQYLMLQNILDLSKQSRQVLWHNIVLDQILSMGTSGSTSSDTPILQGDSSGREDGPGHSCYLHCEPVIVRFETCPVMHAVLSVMV